MPFPRSSEVFFDHPTLAAVCTFLDPDQLDLDYDYQRQQQGLPDPQQIPGVVLGGKTCKTANLGVTRVYAFTRSEYQRISAVPWLGRPRSADHRTG